MRARKTVSGSAAQLKVSLVVLRLPLCLVDVEAEYHLQVLCLSKVE